MTDPAHPGVVHQLHPAKAVRVGDEVVGSWDDPDETPIAAVVRLNNEVIEKERELLRLNERLGRIETELGSVRTALATAHGQHESMARQHGEFRVLVRDTAIRVADEQSWCRPGLNEVLEELGLERHVTRFRVPITVQAKQTVWVEVEAESEDAAESAVTDEAVDEAVDEDEWETGEWEKDYYSSTEAIPEDY
jgi:hypothetical protein